jgi:nucleotide-binding universal stress UspA family protein
MFSRIVVPLDGSALSEAVVPAVVRLAAGTLLEVVLLAVAAMPEEIEERDSVISHLDEIIQEEEADLARYLERHAHRLRAGRITAQTRVRFGEPAAEIVRCAEEEEADAIAMSTHGRTGLSRLIHGSVAGTVLRTTRLPLLLLRPEAAAFARESEQAGRVLARA